ncbi:MAG: tetratricopeptide repeat protein [Cyanobacteria bacterium J06649_11]
MLKTKYLVFGFIMLFGQTCLKAKDNPIANIDSLIHTLSEEKCQECMVDSLNNLVKEVYTSHLDSTYKFSNELVLFLEEINYPFGLARAWSNLGFIAQKKGRYVEAKKYFLNSIPVYASLGRIDSVVSSIIHSLIAFERAGDHQEGVVFGKEVLSTYQTYFEDHPVEKARVINGIGNFYYWQKKFIEASDHYTRALKYFETERDTAGIAFTTQNMGNIAIKSGDFEGGISYLKRAMNLAKEIKSSRIYASCCYSLAAAYGDQVAFDNNPAFWDSSLYILSTAIPIYQELNDYFGIGQIENALGVYSLSKGDYKSALEHYRTAVNINETSEIYQELPKNYFNMGNLFRITGQMDSSLYYLRKAIRLGIDIGQPRFKLDGYAKIAQTYDAFGVDDSAYDYLFKYALLKDSTDRVNISKQLSEQQIVFEVEKKDQQLALQKSQLQQEATLRNSLIAIALLLLTGGAIIAYNYQQRKQAQFETKAQQLENRAIRAQMNPHFVSNIMNSIKYCMVEEGVEKAGMYLDQFHRLLRIVLENSEEEVVELGDELYALDLYIKLEQLRDPKLKVNVEVDEDIPLDSVMIPPLLIQPFVENAIMYRAKMEDENEAISVSLSKVKDEISISISNPIDPQSSTQIMDETDSPRSFATRLTKERLSLLNEQRKVRAMLDRQIKDGVFHLNLKLPLLHQF